jgi:hypothetical protein
MQHIAYTTSPKVYTLFTLPIETVSGNRVLVRFSGLSKLTLLALSPDGVSHCLLVLGVTCSGFCVCSYECVHHQHRGSGAISNNI